jgi:gluconokinase
MQPGGEVTEMPQSRRLPPVVVMGVAGCGKSVIGSALAEALGARFVEGDQLHPLENVAKMSAGAPLNDQDRAGWLDAIGAVMAEHEARGEQAVVACSALKQIYRDALRAFVPGAVFVHLALERATAQRRVKARRRHFMPPSLVDSQFATLEPLQPGEAGVTIDAQQPLHVVVGTALAFVRGRGPEQQLMATPQS